MLIPSLGKELNLIRLFESHFLQWDIEFSDRGELFENEIRKKLSDNNITVTKKPIEFNASDGRQIEYDVIVYFDNNLFIIEAKCLKNPYTPYDKKSCKAQIDKGIKQLKRREKTLYKDWDKIREVSNINLPKEPPREKNIKSILITNIFNFTGFENNKVRVTDLRSFLRYFESSHVKRIILKENEVEESVHKKIWKNGEPSAEELWNFIKQPIALERIIKNINLKYRPIQKINNADNILAIPYTEIDSEFNN